MQRLEKQNTITKPTATSALSIKIIDDEPTCKSLWQKYCPQKTLWDLWEFRRMFHLPHFKFHFMLCFEGNEEIGVVPLVHDPKKAKYIYFGDDFMERNRFLLSKKEYIAKVCGHFPRPLELFFIEEEDAKQHDAFIPCQKRYFLPLTNYTSFEGYLASFSKKHRKNVRYDLRQVEELKPALKINEIADFERLSELSKERFGSESDFYDADHLSCMKTMIKWALDKGMLDLIGIQIENKTEAVGLGIIFNKVYYVLCVTRNADVMNLGKQLIKEQISRAIERGCIEIDFLATEASWKELWNFSSEDTFELVLD